MLQRYICDASLKRNLKTVQVMITRSFLMPRSKTCRQKWYKVFEQYTTFFLKKLYWDWDDWKSIVFKDERDPSYVRKSFLKTIISYPLIRTRRFLSYRNQSIDLSCMQINGLASMSERPPCAYQGVRNVSFLGHYEY